MNDPPPARVLVAFDGSDKDAAALEWALTNAPALGAQIEVVHALGLRESANHRSNRGAESAHDRAVRQTTEAMRRVIAAVPGADRHDIALTILSGHPALLLLDLIATTHPDLVVLGRRSSAAGAAATLGSVSQEVAGRALVPVVVVPHS